MLPLCLLPTSPTSSLFFTVPRRPKVILFDRCHLSIASALSYCWNGHELRGLHDRHRLCSFVLGPLLGIWIALLLGHRHLSPIAAEMGWHTLCLYYCSQRLAICLEQGNQIYKSKWPIQYFSWQLLKHQLFSWLNHQLEQTSTRMPERHWRCCCYPYSSPNEAMLNWTQHSDDIPFQICQPRRWKSQYEICHHEHQMQPYFHQARILYLQSSKENVEVSSCWTWSCLPPSNLVFNRIGISCLCSHHRQLMACFGTNPHSSPYWSFCMMQSSSDSQHRRSLVSCRHLQLRTVCHLDWSNKPRVHPGSDFSWGSFIRLVSLWWLRRFRCLWCTQAAYLSSCLSLTIILQGRMTGICSYWWFRNVSPSYFLVLSNRKYFRLNHQNICS